MDTSCISECSYGRVAIFRPRSSIIATTRNSPSPPVNDGQLTNIETVLLGENLPFSYAAVRHFRLRKG